MDHQNLVETSKKRKLFKGEIEFVDVNQDGWLDVAVSGNSDKPNPMNCRISAK